MTIRPRHRWEIGLVLAWSLVIAGCVAGPHVPAASSASLPAPIASAQPETVLPVDSAITAVSISKVGSAAATVLDSCGIVYSLPGHNGTGLGVGVVSGMGLVPHARDIGRYAAIGPQPNIQTDAPAWLVTTTGWFAVGLSDAASGIESKDPTCYSIGADVGDVTWVSTGGTRQAGVVIPPLDFPSPTYRLPSLLP